MGLLNWVRTGARVFDPGRDARISTAATELERQLAERRSKFKLADATAHLDIFQDELPLVAAATFSSLLRRALNHGELRDSDKKTLDWATDLLNLTTDDRRHVEKELACEFIGQILAQAAAQQAFSPADLQQIHRIAISLSLDANEILKQQFANWSAQFLKNEFCRQSTNFGEPEWLNLLATAHRLVVDRERVLIIIRDSAEASVQKLVTIAQQSGRIEGQEWGRIHWLLTNLIIRKEFRDQILASIARSNFEADINAGKLPSIQSSAVEIRAGEIVHMECPAQFQKQRRTTNGAQTYSFSGILTLSDSRLLFRSSEVGIEVSHHRVLHLTRYSNGFGLATTGKGTGTYLPASEPALFARMYEVAIAKTNRTIVQPGEGHPSRHIPQDVRQRVYQQYGGRCAECGADDYLEFDHIIPVAKGGGNGENNVQLLCRRCNGKKSDRI